MKRGLFILSTLALIVLAAAIYTRQGSARATQSSLPSCLTIGIQDRTTGEGVQTGAADYPFVKNSYGPTDFGDLGGWIKAFKGKGERVAVSFDILSATNGQPTSIMAHFTFEKAGAKTNIDQLILVSRPDVIPTWAKLDDQFETTAYLYNGSRAFNQ